jgi:hypothetical protein
MELPRVASISALLRYRIFIPNNTVIRRNSISTRVPANYLKRSTRFNEQTRSCSSDRAILAVLVGCGLRRPGVGALVRARSTARWQVVHYRSRGKARACPNCSDAGQGKGRKLTRGPRPLAASQSVMFSGLKIAPVPLPASAWREGRVADASALCCRGGCSKHYDRRSTPHLREALPG